MSIRCWLGWHDWWQTRDVLLLDENPSRYPTYTPPRRTCLRCGRKETWLPGHGGETGCWVEGHNAAPVAADEPYPEDETIGTYRPTDQTVSTGEKRVDS